MRVEPMSTPAYARINGSAGIPSSIPNRIRRVKSVASVNRFSAMNPCPPPSGYASAPAKKALSSVRAMKPPTANARRLVSDETASPSRVK